MVSLLIFWRKGKQNVKRKPEKFSGLNFVRSSVIVLMESIPELNELQDEAWYNAEDRITKLIEEIIEEVKPS